MSYLEKLTPIFHILPEVRIPKRHIPFKEKISWSILILALYFLLGEIRIYGVTTTQQNFFGRLQVVLASEMGTLITLGIGPIVTAGIMMQLLQGAEMINLDLTTSEGKKTFQGTQKLLAIVLCFFEATMFAFGGLFGRPPLNQTLFIALQMGIGGFLILMMDEVVTKWGFGSGISLFIAAGVSKDIIWKSLSPLRPDNPTEFIGAVVDFIHSVIVGVPQFTRPALPDILELFFTLVVFFIVVYAESMRIEIPLSYGRFRGVRGRFPIRFIYASNIPVILTVAVFQSTTVFGRLLTNRFHWDWLARFDPQSNLPSSGILYYISSPGGLSNVRADPVHASIYLIIMIASCIFWAYMWIEMTNMGPKAVAKRLQQSGMQIPGFRRDIRIVEKVLSRYIPKVTIMGGAFIGLLAAFADFTNALGTGTGILLTVGIVYRMYEELMREQVSEMFPALRGFLEG